MDPNSGPPVVPPINESNRPSVPKGGRWLLVGCGSLLGLLLVIMATVAITLWWIQRPIKPVTLSVTERAAVDEKLRRLGGTAGNPSNTTLSRDAAPPPVIEHAYVPGSKELRLTERELNGLLNANTELGNTIRLELGQDAINAYLAVPIPQDFPVGGGRIFRARGRFRLSLSKGEAPFAVLEDVTVFGVSLPKAWLGGLKGENLIADAVGKRNGSPVFQGIKSLKVLPGALVLQVED